MLSLAPALEYALTSMLHDMLPVRLSMFERPSVSQYKDAANSQIQWKRKGHQIRFRADSQDA
jgi:hypothetical protein